MKYCQFPLASPYPAVHSGGMSAVAIATPGITLSKVLRVCPIIPANPPNIAMNTSKIFGSVRANSSDVAA